MPVGGKCNVFVCGSYEAAWRCCVVSVGTLPGRWGMERILTKSCLLEYKRHGGWGLVGVDYPS